nr:asparagine synthase-related protein [Bacillus cereus]
MFNEFKKTVTEIHMKSDNYQFSFATNESNKIENFYFEDVLIVGDIALHNKEEIIKKYGLDKRVDVNIESEKLLIYLYKENGIKFIQDMVGEFAFILYDQKEKKYYAIRDQMGVKTLFWTKYNNSYMFASDIFILRKFFDFNDINYNYFKEFHERNGIVDTEITPYKSVYRIPSGSYLNATKDVFELCKYWELSSVSGSISYKKESDYMEEFSELLHRSVKDRLSKVMKNSILLSGGMDSTSIYAMAKKSEKTDNRLYTKGISAVFNELKECDEKKYIYELTNKYNDEGIFINCDNVFLFENFPYNVPFSYEPNDNSVTFNITYSIVKKSVDNGYVNILSGYAGDHLLTGSLYVARDFIRKGQFAKALSYVTNYSIVNNTSAFKNFIQYILSPNILKERELCKDTIYYKEMEKKTKLIKHFHQKELYYEMSHAKCHLYSDRVIGALAGADINHPFLDRRLVEYIYKIPGELRFSEENTKHILRKSMEKYLPISIVNRIDKTEHLAHLYKNIRQDWYSILKVMENPMIVKKLNLISADSWKEELKKCRNGLANREDFWILFSIELWLIKYFRKLYEINHNS